MKEKDQESAERLVNAYSDMILRLSYTYLKSIQDAEDICQTVLIKLLTGGNAFESPEHEKSLGNTCDGECLQGRASRIPQEICGIECCGGSARSRGAG